MITRIFVNRANFAIKKMTDANDKTQFYNTHVDHKFDFVLQKHILHNITDGLFIDS